MTCQSCRFYDAYEGTCRSNRSEMQDQSVTLDDSCTSHQPQGRIHAQT